MCRLLSVVAVFSGVSEPLFVCVFDAGAVRSQPRLLLRQKPPARGSAARAASLRLRLRVRGLYVVLEYTFFTSFSLFILFFYFKYKIFAEKPRASCLAQASFGYTKLLLISDFCYTFFFFFLYCESLSPHMVQVQLHVQQENRLCPFL